MPELLTCPLCDWTAESAVAAAQSASSLSAAPAVAAALGLPTEGLLSIHGHQAARQDETTLERHLSTHGPTDWLPALMDARRAAQTAESMLAVLQETT